MEMVATLVSAQEGTEEMEDGLGLDKDAWVSIIGITDSTYCNFKLIKLNFATK